MEERLGGGLRGLSDDDLRDLRGGRSDRCRVVEDDAVRNDADAR